MSHFAVTRDNFPPPPPRKTGWLWTEQSNYLTEQMSDSAVYPRISIITPSYNQGQFIEQTIRSVLLQGYPNLEYIIIDGGSTDNSVEIIKKYEPYLAYWVSEPDRGQAHALNKGFRKATGDWIGWQNSDDYYHPNIFKYAIQSILTDDSADILYGATHNVDANGAFLRAYPVSSFALDQLIPYLNMCNQSMLFSKRIFSELNFIDETFHHAMDQEFIVRLALKGYRFKFIPKMLGYYRVHEESKGSQRYEICMRDCLRIYQSIYLNQDLPISFRKKALQCIHWACLDSFAKQKFSLFRQGVKEFVKTAGLYAISSELYLKYLLSFLGENIITIKEIKHILEAENSP